MTSLALAFKPVAASAHAILYRKEYPDKRQALVPQFNCAFNSTFWSADPELHAEGTVLWTLLSNRKRTTLKASGRLLAAMGPGAGDVTVKDIVLVGGGHSHTIVLKNFGMYPVPGVRITLIARDVQTPYSGMLPGYVAGHYSYDECHIDLRPLARFANARFIHCSATGIDLKEKKVHLQGRPSVPYDVLSIDIGVTPLQAAAGATEFSVPVKPIDTFTQRWKQIRERLLASERPMRLALVGGGAGGVELLLAMQHRLQNDLKAAGQDPKKISFHLHTRGGLLPTHAPKVGKIFSRICKERGVEVVANGAVREVKENALILEDGSERAFDECVWCTQGGAARWLQETGLALDSAGFILVDETLQSISARHVFAVGDIHSSISHPRERAGVIAVRQGPPLADNLRRAVLGKPLKRFVPQKKWLSLISTGNHYAIASRGGLVLEGAYLWGLKDHIDRSFMRKFSELPEMKTSGAMDSPVARAAGSEVLSALAAVPMRCGGCGAKVASSVLSRVLRRLDAPTRPEVVLGLTSADDAAVVRLPPGTVGVHTVDFFRSFLDDVFLFGKISANHALSDCYAMGAQPISALALAVVPYGIEAKTEDELFQLMAGAAEVLREADCALIGGHSSEGGELALGFAVNGAVREENLLRKGGMQEGDLLLVTKAIGTGTLFAADMRGKAKGRWVDGAIESMLQSNKMGAEILQEYGARACTDVTGFGLLGHLAEMAKASEREVELDLQSVPLLEGALQCVKEKIFSSMQPNNVRLNRAIANLEQVSQSEKYPLLFDPQTSGGLLASVPASAAQNCLEELRRRGYSHAALIGKVGTSSESETLVRIV